MIPVGCQPHRLFAGGKAVQGVPPQGGGVAGAVGGKGELVQGVPVRSVLLPVLRRAQVPLYREGVGAPAGGLDPPNGEGRREGGRCIPRLRVNLQKRGVPAAGAAAGGKQDFPAVPGEKHALLLRRAQLEQLA